jgi:hypothetical protein
MKKETKIIQSQGRRAEDARFPAVQQINNNTINAKFCHILTRNFVCQQPHDLELFNKAVL